MNYRSKPGKEVTRKRSWLGVFIMMLCLFTIAGISAFAQSNPAGLQDKGTNPSEYEIKIFSNHALNQISFSLMADEPMKIQVMVFDIIGNKLLDEHIQTEPEHPPYQIPTNNLRNGIYIVQFSAGSLQKSYKVILQ